jgi:hypothetical protein
VTSTARRGLAQRNRRARPAGAVCPGRAEPGDQAGRSLAIRRAGAVCPRRAGGGCKGRAEAGAKAGRSLESGPTDVRAQADRTGRAVGRPEGRA